MTTYETWDEMNPRTNHLITATDASPGAMLVRLEEYDRLREEMFDLRDDLRPLAEREEGMWRHVYTRVCTALQEAGDE